MSDTLEGFALLAIPPRDLPTVAAVFVLAVGFGFGALWGSFLNVVIARVPRGQSVVSPRSRCPKCETQIAGYDNIPILSWLILRAKCRQCGTPISIRYPFVELLGAVSGAAAVARFGFTVPALELFCFFLILIAISFIDLDTFTVPYSLIVWLTGTGLVFGAIRWLAFGPASSLGLSGVDFRDRVIGAVGAWIALAAIIVVATGIIRRVSPDRLPDGETAMGWGDPLILVGIGAHIGWQLLPLTLFIASVVGSVVGLAAKYSGKLKNRAPLEDGWVPPDDAVPFGPFLALGGILTACFGDQMVAWLGPMMGFGQI